MRLNPFRPLRPAPHLAEALVAPPYDVVSRREAAALAAGNPLSFLHVSRAEIDLPDAIDPHDARVYARAREALDRLRAHGALVREAEASLYVYRQERAGRVQVGVAGCVHVEDYEQEVIRKHETTRPDKEDDRTRHMLALGANPEPVLLLHPDRPEVDRLAAAGTAGPPLYDITAAEGVRHTVWRLPETALAVEAFARVPHAYVADGHHRSASAWRAGRARRAGNPRHTGAEAYNWFPAALFPASQLTILPYHRVVADLGGHSPEEVLARLARVGRLSPAADPAPPRPASFCLYLAGRWHLLELPHESIDPADPIGSLDVSLLHRRVLEPLLGVGDPRTDKRIDFVGGGRGVRELQRRVDAGEAALAVSLYPTTVAQLIAVADAGASMPPKSTWFEPKLLSGLFVHPLD